MVESIGFELMAVVLMGGWLAQLASIVYGPLLLSQVGHPHQAISSEPQFLQAFRKAFTSHWLFDRLPPRPGLFSLTLKLLSLS